MSIVTAMGTYIDGLDSFVFFFSIVRAPLQGKNRDSISAKRTDQVLVRSAIVGNKVTKLLSHAPGQTVRVPGGEPDRASIP